MIALLKMWIERCETFHENAINRIRIEDYETLMNKVENTSETHEILPQELETHRRKVN